MAESRVMYNDVGDIIMSIQAGALYGVIGKGRYGTRDMGMVQDTVYSRQ